MEHYLVEREAHPELAQAFEQMLDSAITDPLVGLVHYAKLETLLLAECGFGLDARQCALSGVTEGLSHVSPRSGRAVCAAAAGPYLSKLLPLPAFLLQENPMISHEILPDVVDALALTGYFLQHWLVEATGRQLPAARARLVASVGLRGAAFDQMPTPSRAMLPMLDIA
jgi:DNA repair protein RecO (recombination protein O)